MVISSLEVAYRFIKGIVSFIIVLSCGRASHLKEKSSLSFLLFFPGPFLKHQHSPTPETVDRGAFLDLAFVEDNRLSATRREKLRASGSGLLGRGVHDNARWLQ